MFLRLLSALLLFNSTIGFAQCDSNDFKRLFFLVNQGKVSGGELNVARDIVSRLEAGRCYEYEIKQNGEVIGMASLTKVYATICQFANSAQGIEAFIAYMDKAAEDNQQFIPESFEMLFEANPALVLQTVTNGGILPAYYAMEQLAIGFVMKHRTELTTDNYRKAFLYAYPGLSELYPSYQKQLDFASETILRQLQ